MVAATAKTFPRHTHDQFGVGVVIAGRHLSASDNRQVEANPGDVILVNPGEIHDGRALDERGRSWRMLYFESAVLESAYRDVTQKEGAEFALCAPVLANESIGSLFNRAFTSATQDMPAALDASLLELVARLSVLLGRHRIISDAPAGALDRVRELIHDDLTADLSLEALSRAAGLSRFQLHRSFLKKIGLAPHAYILQQRVTAARRLIKAGTPLAEVAAASGFCDQSHLNRVFVQQFGVSPGQYAHRSNTG